MGIDGLLALLKPIVKK